MHARTILSHFLQRFVLLGLFAASSQPLIAQAPVALDPTNPQYFTYNGATVPLIGMSGEYLPHVSRYRGTVPNMATIDKECTFDSSAAGPPFPTTSFSYWKCFNKLKLASLNTTQLWVSLNSSPGSSGRPLTPFNSEQPFSWDPATSRWKVSQYDSTFIFNLRKVISEAKALGIIVEVTLFDPWSGNDLGTSGTSPWNPLNNCGFNESCPANPANQATPLVSFTDTRYVVSYQRDASGNNDTVLSIANARTRQLALVTQIVQQVREFPNVIFEIANEADLVPNGKTAPVLDAMMDWHNAIAAQIAANDSASKHLIAVNFLTQASLDEVNRRLSLPATDPDRLNPNIRLVNSHYVNTPTAGGAIDMIRGYLNGPRGDMPIAFGFNEGRATPSPVGVGARAEAWEFMLNEGGLYDNYNLNFFDPGSDTVRTYLKRLKSFLVPSFNLSAIGGRQAGTTPGWAGGLFNSGTHTSQDLTGGNTYWAAMQIPRLAYGLYVHHSHTCVPNSGLTRYKPVCKASPGYKETLNLHLGNISKSFRADWFTLDQDLPVCSHVITWSGTSPGVTVTSPPYPYDLALRLTVCTPGASGNCPTATDCLQQPAPLTCPLMSFPDNTSCP